LRFRRCARQAGKDPTGSIVVTVEQEGNEVAVEIRDDGAGLDLARIHRRAVEMGLLAADARPTDQELANLIFTPGLSTVRWSPSWPAGVWAWTWCVRTCRPWAGGSRPAANPAAAPASSWCCR
jgi:hypothetical protein